MSRLLRNLKGRVPMGKGGRQSNPIPEIGTGFAVATTERVFGKRA